MTTVIAVLFGMWLTIALIAVRELFEIDRGKPWLDTVMGMIACAMWPICMVLRRVDESFLDTMRRILRD